MTDMPAPAGARPDDQAVSLRLAQETRDFVEKEDWPRRRRPWDRWLQATLGLRDYWYPAALSRHLPEGQTRAVKLLGEELLLVRKAGQLYAIEDRCAHRGARFSKRPLVLSEDTITCWYHTWTYNLDDGKLRCILNDPDTALIDKVGIRAYQAQEAKGVIFVFVGDIEPPPLSADVPPGFLDGDMAIYCAEPEVVKANWRLCLENGFDPGHHFIHNWSRYILDSGFPMTFGFVARKGEEHNQVSYIVNEPGPKGFTRCTRTTELIFEATIPGRNGHPDAKFIAPGMKGKKVEDLIESFNNAPPITVGIWLPCGDSTENFPAGITHFDWVVPIDEHTTMYFQVGGKRCATPQEADEWITTDGHMLWEIPVVEGFTNTDNFAREGLEKFYSDEQGWYRERLYRPDVEITMFRKFFTEHARNIQTREHADGLAYSEPKPQ